MYVPGGVVGLIMMNTHTHKNKIKLYIIIVGMSEVVDSGLVSGAGQEQAVPSIHEERQADNQQNGCCGNVFYSHTTQHNSRSNEMSTSAVTPTCKIGAGERSIRPPRERNPYL